MPHNELSTTGGGQGHLIIRELEGLEKKAIFRSKIPVSSNGSSRYMV